MLITVLCPHYCHLCFLPVIKVMEAVLTMQSGEKPNNGDGVSHREWMLECASRQVEEPYYWNTGKVQDNSTKRDLLDIFTPLFLDISQTLINFHVIISMLLNPLLSLSDLLFLHVPYP